MANQRKHNRNRKHKRQTPHIEGNAQSPLGMGTMLGKFLEDLAVKNFSGGTIHKRRCQINEFVRWANQRSLDQVNQIQRPILQRYQRYLFYYRQKNDKPLSFRTQHVRLSSLRSWFAWLTRNNYLMSNPASELELPRIGRPLPRDILSNKEVEIVLAGADIKTPLGIRDRAIMETLYSTGIRRQEVADLDVYDVDSSRGVLRIRHGKGDKDRVVPIGDRALAWVQKYQQDVRPGLVIDHQKAALYLGAEGERLSGAHLGRLVRCYIEAAETGKSGSCHLFRHSMATSMLDNGADIRYIQLILGHASLETTQIYTQVSIQKLKEIHKATHPGRESRRTNGDGESPQTDTAPNNDKTSNDLSNESESGLGLLPEHDDSNLSTGPPGSSPDESTDEPKKPKPE